MNSLDQTDRKILNRLQSDFPLKERPFQVVAEEIGLTEDEVIDRLNRLKKGGIIRRIGGNFVPERLGFVSTLCAARVPEDKIEEFARTVNQYPGVTHNYVRDNEYNIWFTFIAPSREEIHKNLEEISQSTGIDDILNLPSTRVFKIRAKFDL